MPAYFRSYCFSIKFRKIGNILTSSVSSNIGKDLRSLLHSGSWWYLLKSLKMIFSWKTLLKLDHHDDPYIKLIFSLGLRIWMEGHVSHLAVWYTGWKGGLGGGGIAVRTVTKPFIFGYSRSFTVQIIPESFITVFKCFFLAGSGCYFANGSGFETVSVLKTVIRRPGLFLTIQFPSNVLPFTKANFFYV